MNGFEAPEPAAGKVIDVRLLPMPNLVMFPGVQQPLYLTEANVGHLLADSLEDDQLVATALLQPGWERAREERPELASTVCVARIISHSRFSDGGWQVLLLGLWRARIRQELPPLCVYRLAEVRGLADSYADATAASRQGLRRELIDAVRSHLPMTRWAQEQFERLLGSQVLLGTLTDMIAFTLDLDVGVKQRLLEESDVDQRAAALIRHLRQWIRQGTPLTGFPPLFSEN